MVCPLVTKYVLLPLGWLAGPWTESTYQSTVLGSSCTFNCYGNLTGVCGSLVPQSLSVSPPLFLHNPYQVCIRMRGNALMSNFTECSCFWKCIFCSHWWNWSYQETEVDIVANKSADSERITVSKPILLYFLCNINLAGRSLTRSPHVLQNISENMYLKGFFLFGNS